MKTRLEVTVSTKNGGKKSPTNFMHLTRKRARFSVVIQTFMLCSRLVASATAGR
jgi:hypothetical protein